MVAGSTFAADLTGIGAVAGTNYDQLNVAGTVNLGSSTLALSLSGFSPNVGDLLFLMQNDGAEAITGIFNGLADNSIFMMGGYQFQIGYAGNAEASTPSFIGGNDLVLQVIPEPATLVLLLSGLGLWLRRRS
jgi:hypothetical protein